MPHGFVDDILESPVGVALLARLETRARFPEGYGLVLDSSPDAVRAAADGVAQMSFGELVDLAVLAGEIDVGPWISDAPATVAAAYRHAELRAPIAIALCDRFGDELQAEMDRTVQQWWGTEKVPVERLAPLFGDFEDVYGAGQFSWAGLWTVSDPPDAAHAQLIDAWELYPGPVSRWRLPVPAQARVFEVHRPADWARLVTEHPREAASHSEHWELPSVNQKQADLTSLLSVPGQRAARTTMRRHLVPDWRSVADRYDGVHLSWAGFISSEGCISDLEGGDVTMLRYWFSERTHWLSDVFGEPEPGPPPSLDELVADEGIGGVDVRTDSDRRRSDADALAELLGRRGPESSPVTWRRPRNHGEQW